MLLTQNTVKVENITLRSKQQLHASFSCDCLFVCRDEDSMESRLNKLKTANTSIFSLFLNLSFGLRKERVETGSTWLGNILGFANLQLIFSCCGNCLASTHSLASILVLMAEENKKTYSIIVYHAEQNMLLEYRGKSDTNRI